MYELIQASENTYYVQCPAKIGIVKINEKDVVLIDSGNDASAGKKIRKILEQQEWTLKAIYNTHSHADHIGGNRYLQGQTGCEIYAPGLEYDFTRKPILEPMFLYGGYPPSELKHKFTMAPESDVKLLTQEALPTGWEMISLSGHSFDMAGFRTQDDVVFLADSLSSRETLEKYGIGFMVDVKAHLATLEQIKSMKAKLFIPSHAEPADDVAELAEINISKIHEIAEAILTICQKPKTFETVLQELFEKFEMTMTFEQHALVGSTVRSYLTWMKEDGKIRFFMEDNMLYWETER